MPSLGHCKFTWNSANNLWTLWPLPDKMKHKEITLTLTPKHFQSYIKVKCTPAYLSLQKDILFYSVLICCVLSFQYQTSPQSRFRSLLNNPEARVEKKKTPLLDLERNRTQKGSHPLLGDSTVVSWWDYLLELGWDLFTNIILQAGVEDQGESGFFSETFYIVIRV